MATALASMLFKPVVSGFKNEAQYIKDSVKSKPLTIDRLTDVPLIMGAFGRGFIGFFKQKTAYEILRSDWSSDVCSSD
eukprot:COSAG05_NODE_16223_length_351_cov_0.595238_2_plen_77_part_01